MSPSRTYHAAKLLKISAALLLVGISALLSSCGSTTTGDTITVVQTRGFQPHHGPFDSKGNYIEGWADKPPKRRYVTREEYAQLNSKKKKRVAKPQPLPARAHISPPPPLVAYTPPKPAAAQPQRYTKPTPKPKKVVKPKPKKKSVAVKPKAKPPIVHKVKKGDTLYGLSRKYKTTIGGIQRANKLTSTHIGIGDRLIIPRK